MSHQDDIPAPDRTEMLLIVHTAAANGRPRESMLRHLMEKGCNRQLAESILDEAFQKKLRTDRLTGLRNIVVGLVIVAIGYGITQLLGPEGMSRGRNGAVVIMCYLGGGGFTVYGLSQVIGPR